MNKEDIQKLIGGYATGSLTDEERHKLFEAALDDQELFDTLQQEEPLRDLFDDPFSREQVRRAAAEGLPRRPRTSWFRRPWIWASAASVALAGVLVVALVRWDRTQPPPTIEKQAVATSQQPTAEPPPQPDREKSASEPPAPKPRLAAGKPPAGTVKSPVLDDRRGDDSKESTGGFKGGTLPARRSASRGGGGSGGSGRSTGTGDSPSTHPSELSKNRERDSSDSANDRKGAERGEPASPTRAISPSAPVNSIDTLRNSNESRRNVAEAPRNSIEAPRNTVELPRKDDPVAPLPPTSSQAQLERGRQSGPSQIQQPQQVQAPPQAPEIRYRSQAGQIPAATAAPNPASQPRDSEGKLHRATTVKSESTDEMMKAKTASLPKSKAVGSSPALAKKAVPVKVRFYSLARRTEDGSYVGVSAETIFQPGETVRVTIVPSVAGPVSIEESDAANPVWRQVFPADSDRVGVAEKETSAVTVDIFVKKNQRLRVKTEAQVTPIPIRTGAAVGR
jgi:hypothetical protein